MMISDEIKSNVDTKTLYSLQEEKTSFPPKEKIIEKAHISSLKQYEHMYRQSLENSDLFWLEQAESLKWFKKPSCSCKYSWDTDSKKIYHKWFEDGFLNVSVNCLDRHLDSQRGEKTAILWQGEEDGKIIHLSYRELYKKVCRFANLLKRLGVRKGDRVCLYLPMIPELAIATLACARIGAIHSVIFGGFSASSLSDRINDSSAKLIITANMSLRGAKPLLFKEIVDEALEKTPSIQKALIVRCHDSDCSMKKGRDLWVHEALKGISQDCPPEKMNAEDPLFILYTSGSTGKPKGVVHTTAGYLLHASLSHKWIFDLQDDDVYWCTADIGWITGHSYILYGPLANGATTVMFEGIPTHPNPGRFWQIIEKHKISIFYTAPTAIRTLMSYGDHWPNKYDLSSLRLLGTVGEPINPKAWMWYYQTIGKEKCPIVDTWWQTETGGILISPMPGAHPLKPGSASRPFFGVDPIILNSDGTECQNNEGGQLCIRRPWPGMMRTMWRDHERFIQTYFTQHKNLYFTADGCHRDDDGDYWLMGRIDDIINISGHNISTAEVESAMVSHALVAEAAVVPIPHDVKGQALYVFVTLIDKAWNNNEEETTAILKQHVRKKIGPIATPETVQFAKSLPKTRSGKIMRRILRKIAEKDVDNLGDISTLADPNVIKSLLGFVKY